MLKKLILQGLLTATAVAQQQHALGHVDHAKLPRIEAFVELDHSPIARGTMSVAEGCRAHILVEIGDVSARSSLFRFAMIS